MNATLKTILLPLYLVLMAFNLHTAPGYAVDIVWEGVTYDDETVSKLITVITGTSYIHTHPDTKHIRPAQESLYRIPAFALCKKLIAFDGIYPQYRGTKEEDLYEQYKLNVMLLTDTDPYFTNTECVFCPWWMHLSGALRTAMDYVETPFVFVHQHDLRLQKDFDLNGVIATMVANPNIKYVNLWSGINSESEWYNWPLDQVIEGPHFVPLCRSFGWSDQCHIARADYYREFVLPQCHYCFMEAVLNRAIKDSANELGRDEGHKPFGAYLYGDLSDGNYIYHSDGHNN